MAAAMLSRSGRWWLLAYVSGAAGWLLACALHIPELATLCPAGSGCEAAILPADLYLTILVFEWVAGGACGWLTTRYGLGRTGPNAGLLGVGTVALATLFGPIDPGLWIALLVASSCLAFLIGFAGIWAALHATGAYPGSRG